MIAILRQFFIGLTSPSVRALFTAFSILIVFFLYITWSGDRLMHRSIDAYYANAPIGKQKEDPLYVTREIIRLHEGNSSSIRKIAIFGASTNRESLAGLNFLSKGVSEQTGVTWEAANLTSSGQTMLESLLMANSLPSDFHGVVLLGVNPLRFNTGYPRLKRRFAYQETGVYLEGWSEISTELGLRQPNAVSQMLLPHPSFSLLLFRYLRTSLLRQALASSGLLDTSLAQSRTNTRHYYTGQKKQDEATWRSVAEYTGKVLADPANTKRLNLSQLRKTVAVLASKGIDIILFESPINPRFLREVITEKGYAEYDREISDLANELGFAYLRINEQSDFSEDEFYDWGHLNTDASRNKYSEVLVEKLSETLQQMDVTP